MIPTCALCRKFNRRCVYEKQYKTPLTRRYLTQVEQELARTKELLQQFLPEARAVPVDMPADRSNEAGYDQLNEHSFSSPASSRRANSSSSIDRVGNAGSENGQTGDDRPSSFPSAVSIGSTHEAAPVPSMASHRATQVENGRTPAATQSRPFFPQRSRDTQSVGTRSQLTGGSTFSMEMPPSSGNFEWDERSGKPSGDKFVDGMASLTSGSNEGGYLGVASGAALLRMAETRSNNGIDPYGSDRDAENSAPPRSSSIPFALKSFSQLEPFIDAYFRLYHCSYPIVHEATFRAQFMEVIPRPSSNAWQVLLFAVATLGAFTAATQPTDVDIGLFEAAKARLSIDMLETGNMILVQALTLLSNYLQKRNKPNSGYNYMGLARRIAMGIGLHKEFPNWDANLLALEMRRRVWYCLYIFDVGATITFSRPLDFPQDGIDVELPLNIHDSVRTPFLLFMAVCLSKQDVTATTKHRPEPANETTVYTHLRAQATFHLSTCQIYSKIISTPFPSAEELIDLDDRLIGHWLATLPTYFREDVEQAPKFSLCHSILRWRYRNFRILMYRPFLVRQLMARPERGAENAQDQDDPNVEIAIQRCLDAARESVELISKFWMQDQRTMMACWYGLYFLFQAILIPVICLRNNPQSPLALNWRDQIFEAMTVIESMAQLNPTAKRCLGVIRSLCGAYLAPDTDAWDGPTQESPQTQLANLYPLMWPTLGSVQVDGVDPML